jgi:hypothetical protein
MMFMERVTARTANISLDQCFWALVSGSATRTVVDAALGVLGRLLQSIIGSDNDINRDLLLLGDGVVVVFFVATILSNLTYTVSKSNHTSSRGQSRNTSFRVTGLLRILMQQFYWLLV